MTKTIARLDSHGCDVLRRLLDAHIKTAMTEFETKHGVKLKVGQMTYGGSYQGVVIKLEGSLVSDTGAVFDKEHHDFKQFASYYDLTAADWGRKFTCQGSVYAICGIRPNSPKYPILGKHVHTGKVMKFTRSVLKSLYPVAAAA